MNPSKPMVWRGARPSTGSVEAIHQSFVVITKAQTGISKDPQPGFA